MPKRFVAVAMWTELRVHTGFSWHITNKRIVRGSTWDYPQIFRRRCELCIITNYEKNIEKGASFCKYVRLYTQLINKIRIIVSTLPAGMRVPLPRPRSTKLEQISHFLVCHLCVCSATLRDVCGTESTPRSFYPYPNPMMGTSSISWGVTSPLDRCALACKPRRVVKIRTTAHNRLERSVLIHG